MTNPSSKPSFNKNLVMILVILGICLIISMAYYLMQNKKISQEEDKTATVTQAQQEQKAPQEAITSQNTVSPEEMKENFINSTNLLKAYLKEDLPNSDNPSTQVDYLDNLKKPYTEFMNNYPGFKDKQKLLRDFESLYIKVCSRQFPIIRSNYVANVKDGLWKNNIEISLRGPKKDILRFVGGIFASNKNKSDMQDNISSIMAKLRFKRVEYLWYELDDTYTYYTISSLKDNYF